MGDEKPKFFTFRDLHSINQNISTEKPASEKQIKSKTNKSAINDKPEKDLNNVNQSLSANQSLSIQQTPSLAKANDDPDQQVSDHDHHIDLNNPSNPLNSVPQTLNDQQALSVQLTLTNNINGYTSIPNLILDGLIPMLRVQEQAVYLRLYRLSYGFHNTTCRIGFDKLAQNCNLSRREVIRSIEKLEQLGLIVRLGCNFKSTRGTIRGNLYQVNLPKIASADQSHSANQSHSNKPTLNAISSPNKDDDDLVNKQDHHQKKSPNLSDHEKQVMTIYQEVTNNLWSKADRTNYEKIKHIPIEKIEVAVKLAYERASNRPNSFAFFIKEILTSLSPKTQSRSNRKKAMIRIVERVRNASVGSNISPSEFAYKVKEICLKEDVNFDNDLFDELMNKA